MPTKMIILVKRKSGLSPEEFRAGYEGSHSRIGVELFGHLWASYTRNYIRQGTTFLQRGAGKPDGPDEIGFDAITEIVFKHDNALEELGKISLKNRDRIAEDEALWFDQTRCWTVFCDTIVEDLSLRGNDPPA